MKTPQQPTENQFAIFAFFTLSQAARDWSYLLKGTVEGEFKKRLSALHYAQKYLSSLFKAKFGEDMITSLENEAAIWNEVMTLLKTGTTADKTRFVSFLKAFQDGHVREQHAQDSAAA